MKLQGQIAALPGVASVDTFDNFASTPSDATLDQYDVVVTTDNFPPADAVALGNNLADYEDQGGVVVATEFFWQSGAEAAAGRWLTGGYSPYHVGSSNEDATVTLGAHDATSPLLQGVSSLTDYYHQNPALAAGATEVAKWSDGFSAVAFKGNAVGINAYVGNLSGGSYWSGDYAKIIVNAGNVLGRHTLTITKGGTGAGSVTSVPAGINCGATCAFNYTNGTRVTLTAVPSSGSSFTGWSGAGCSGTSSCTVTMIAAKAVTATFKLGPPHGTTITKAKINKKKHKATFKFRASGTITGFQCALARSKGKHHKAGKLVFRACSSPKTYKHLKHGRYKFEVRAVNSAGVDSTPAIKKFKI